MKFSLILKIILGFLALSLGAIGLFLPIWPTTPFVLLAVGCFSSTPKMQRELLRIRIFREYYEGYTKKLGLPWQTVVLSLCFLWGMLFISTILIQKVYITLLLLLIGIAVTIHILWISKKSRKELR